MKVLLHKFLALKMVVLIKKILKKFLGDFLLRDPNEISSQVKAGLEWIQIIKKRKKKKKGKMLNMLILHASTGNSLTNRHYNYNQCFRCC